MMGRISTREDWMAERRKLLAAEKEFTKQRDALSERRRAMPWVKIETDYVFDAPTGPVKLADLFAGRSQLVVYHFMFAPNNEWGCKSCSFWADHFDGEIPHLNARDTSFVAISRAPLEKLQRQAKRLGWKFPWVSSGNTTFNYDFAVSFDDPSDPTNEYNYTKSKLPHPDLPGYSVFVRGQDGEIYHTYSTFARGIDLNNGTYNVLDMTPQGRNEGPQIMSWVKFHDEYPAA
ncbi:MAG: DUF899 domain-containing protein [Burkholderiales bacterium]|nr:MAG: DUF899 domain-containing protein [Burkholderiales bacterium]